MGWRRYFLVGKKIIGVASNYRCHIAEMGGSIPTDPVFFLKPTSSYLIEPHPIQIPEGCQVDHEGNIKRLSMQLFSRVGRCN